MKKIRIIILLLTFFCSCNFEHRDKNNSVISQAEVTVPGKTNDSIAADKIDGLPALSYKFNVDSLGHFLKTIIIYAGNTPVQVIGANKDIDKKDFHLVDWNFDGYNDISVLYNCGSGGCAYWIWNYSPAIKKYYYNKELSERLGLEMDSASRYIIFHYKAGYPEEYWDTLQYINGKLTFVKGSYQQRWNDSLGNPWVKHIRTQMVGNKPVTKVDSSIIYEK